MTLVFPTANLSVDDLTPIANGIYAVEIEINDGPYKGTYEGVASAGVRPTFGENKPNFETFIFDFSGDIYGTYISVSLIEWLRPEIAYTTTDALVEQMYHDCANARAALKNIENPW